jgi:hypothetical protein
MSLEIPELEWLDAAANPWRIPVLDVRPVTQHLVSASSDPMCAVNAVSYGFDSGASFIGAEPPMARLITTSLPYRTDGPLSGGALFRPSVMEHKWAIFYQFDQLFFVRGWQRKVYVVADTKEHGAYLEVRSIQGTFLAERELPDFSRRVLDFLIRTHALGLQYPAPLLPGIESDPRQAALWCFSSFGNMAHFAALEDPGDAPPIKALKTL